MAQYYDVHPDNPQPRTLNQMVRILEEGGLIAYPTDSCYALGCALGNGTGIERISTKAPSWANSEITRVK